MQIGRQDVIWNYAATFLHIAAGVILLPFILRMLPQETVAIWTIFTTIIALTSLLDFGFNPSFARNVSYVVSGAKKLEKQGFHIVNPDDTVIDYSLFKGLIAAMRWFYSRVSILLFIVLMTLGLYYIKTILQTYSGDHKEVYIAWGILCVINTYSLYTQYYDSLMQGQGLIKRAKQIRIISQLVYLIVAIVLILLRFNLIAIVSAQALSILITRILSYKTVYTKDFKSKLRNVVAQSKKSLIKVIYPNAVKIGLTSVGGFLVTRSSVLIGSLFLSLEIIASYGITIQIIGVISAVSTVYFSTYQPKIVQLRVQNDNATIKSFYLKACLFLLSTYIAGGLGLLLLGDWALNIIGSQTPLLPSAVISCALLYDFLVSNHGMAAMILLTKNTVPFLKASLISGVFTVALLFLFFKYTNLGVWGLVLAPGITQICYQNWKWPLEVIKELKISLKDIKVNVS